MLPLVAGGLLLPALLAQEKKGAAVDALGTIGPTTYPLPALPIVPASLDALKTTSSQNGKIGFVTVDAYELPPIKLIGKTKKPNENSLVQSKLPAAPSKPVDPPSSNRVNPFLVVAEKRPTFDGLEAQPFVPTKSAAKASVFTPRMESPKFDAASSKPAPESSKREVEMPKAPPLPSHEIQSAQHLNVFQEKLVQAPIVLPAPQLQVAAQKEQPVPVPLPQVVPPPGAEKPAILPQPRPVPLPGFQEGQVRMPVLGDAQLTPLGMTPYPTAKDLAEQDKYVKGFIDPNNTLDLIQSRARLMMMKQTPKRIQVSDEAIVTYTVIDNKELPCSAKRRARRS
jgi:hypothetical protein